VPVTPVHQLPYPSEDDIPDVPADIGRLATALDSALGTVDTWQPLTLQNGWSGSAYFKMYPDGTVALAGSINSPGAGFDPSKQHVFATLPAKYCPQQGMSLTLSQQCTTDRFTGNYLARIAIGPAGGMSMQNLSTKATNAPFFLDGIRFPIDVPKYTRITYSPPDYDASEE